jgi:FkbM family methyltransferase
MADGDRLHLDLRERMCLGLLFHQDIPHERGVLALMGALMREGDCYVDVGANVGFHTRRAARLVGPTGRVIALEPAPNTLRLLRLNTAELGNVTVLPVAAADGQGHAPFYIRTAGDTSSLLPSREGHVIQVETVTLDAALAGIERVDLLKVDVEGCEYRVLKGAQGVIGRTRPAVIFEHLCHNKKPAEVGIDAYRELFAAMPDARYAVYAILEDARDVHLRLAHHASHDVANYLAVPLERATRVSRFLEGDPRSVETSD